MSIITRIRLDPEPTTGKLIIKFDRTYPSSYNEDDAFILEKYALDLSDENIRRELREAIKSQTVMQYMSESLVMSASFHMSPINNYDVRDQLFRTADFNMNPEFIDITSVITTQNALYLDNDTSESLLYLYRMVYSYDGEVYNTQYVAGFERISDYLFTSETAGKEIYKTFVTDILMDNLFGDSGQHLKRFFDTEQTETRRAYRQAPTVYRVPGRRVNFRYRGPLEDYKLGLAYREAARHIETTNSIFGTIEEEARNNQNLMSHIDRKALRLHVFQEKDVVLFTSAIEDIAGDDLFVILYRTPEITRVLSKDALGESYLIPNLASELGVYILLYSMDTAEQIRDALEADRFGIESDIYIAHYQASEPEYTIEFQYDYD